MSAVMILALMTTLLTGGSDSGNTTKGADEIDITKLPSRFDLRNVDGKNYVTPVKTQPKTMSFIMNLQLFLRVLTKRKLPKVR